MIKSVTFVNSSHYQKDFIVFLQEVMFLAGQALLAFVLPNPHVTL